jgi:hypothetical protein
MIDRLDVDGYAIGDVLHLVPNSSSPEGSVVFEMPPVTCPLDSPDAEMGAAIVRAAQRCREGENLHGSNSDGVAKALGYKSNADIRKKLVPIGISRRNGGATLTITPMRRERSQIVFTDDRFPAALANPAEIGRMAKEALKISAR